MKIFVIFLSFNPPIVNQKSVEETDMGLNIF